MKRDELLKLNQSTLVFMLFLFIANVVMFNYIHHYDEELFDARAVQAKSRICINRPPTINLSCTPTSLNLGDTFICDVNATDPENVSFNFTFTDNTTLFEINSTTGFINFTTNESHLGTHTIQINVTETEPLCINATGVGLLNLTIENVSVLSLNITIDAYKVKCNDSNVIVNWTDVSADSYELYYSSNLTDLYHIDIFSDPANVTGITSTEYNDTQAFNRTKRFYRVVAVIGSAKNMSTGAAGMQNVQAIAGSKVIVATPFVLGGNESVNHVVCPPQPDCGSSPCADKIRYFFGNKKQEIAYWFGPSFQWVGQGVNPLSEILPNRGYELSPINDSYNLTFAGRVPLPANITWELIGGSKLTAGINNPLYFKLNDNVSSPQPDCGASICADKIRMIYGNKQQKIAYWFGPSFKWVPQGVPGLTYLEPGFGFQLIPINTSYNNTFNTSVGEFRDD